MVKLLCNSQPGRRGRTKHGGAKGRFGGVSMTGKNTWETVLEDSSFIRRGQQTVIPQEECVLDPCGHMLLVEERKSRRLHFHTQRCGGGAAEGTVGRSFFPSHQSQGTTQIYINYKCMADISALLLTS